MKRIACRILLGAAGMLAALPASAGIYCVDTVNEMNVALSDAATNGEDDEIRVVAGTYAPSSGFAFSSQEFRALSIRGGFNANCSTFTGAETVLDGQDERRPLFVYNTDGDVVVEDLTFVNGLSTNNRGGGLRILSNSGDIRVDRCILYANRADDFGGALTASTATGTLRIRNNLAFGNSAAEIGAFEFNQGSGDAYITGNTIFANRTEGDFLPAACTSAARQTSC